MALTSLSCQAIAGAVASPGYVSTGPTEATADRAQ
jgi:hypothetical protein